MVVGPPIAVRASARSRRRLDGCAERILAFRLDNGYKALVLRDE